MVKSLWCSQRGGKLSPYGGWIAAFYFHGWTSLFEFQEPFIFLFFYFFTYLIQRFGLVILRLKLEPVVINVALVFHVPTLDYDLSFLAADGVMSTLVMTKTASNVSMQTWNLCWNNAVKIHKKFTDYTSQRLFRNTDVWCV